MNIAHTWHEMPWPVRIVVATLLTQAVLSIAVVIDRALLLLRSSRRSRGFAGRVTPALEEGRFEDALAIASKADGSHLASYMYVGLRTFLDRRFEGRPVAKAAELTERALERHGEHVSTSLNKGMNILASTGSTAPFVGLLGTVLGILNAFRQIAESGSGGIATIGGAIGEALVVTGLGLAVAIPTVLVFNWLSNQIGTFEAGLANAAGELVDTLESGESIGGLHRIESDAAKAAPKQPVETHRPVEATA